MRLRDGENLSGSIARSLLRYVSILSHERRELRPQFSEDECALILDACNGIAFYDAVSVRLLPENIADAIEFDGLDAKWKVDGPALVAKLKATTFAQRMAIVDAVQRWWNRTATEHPAYGDLLADPEEDKTLSQIY